MAYKLVAGFSVYLVLVAALAVGLACAPAGLTIHLFGHALTPADIGERLLRRGLIMGLLLPGLLAVELALGGWADSSLRRLLTLRSRSDRSDLMSFLFWNAPGHLVVSNLFSLGVVLVSAPWLHQMTARTVGFSVELGTWPLVPQVLVYFYVFSFFDYWQHRLDHSARFWPLHRYHHAAEEFCVLTSVRVHPANFTGVITHLIPALVFGVSEEALFWFWTLNGMVHYVIHTRSQSDFGWVGRWLVQSPLHHRMHHKLDMTYPTGNFSLVPLWDRVFGTWQEVKDPRVPIGVAAPYRQGAWIIPDLLRDYRDFWLALIGRYRDVAGLAPATATVGASAGGEGRQGFLQLRRRLDVRMREVRALVGGQRPFEGALQLFRLARRDAAPAPRRGGEVRVGELDRPAEGEHAQRPGLEPDQADGSDVAADEPTQG